MFKSKKKNSLVDKNYKMKEIYNTDSLLVGSLGYLSNEATPYGPMDKVTKQKYIFEEIIEDDKIRYREIFTGFVLDLENNIFNLPYIVDIRPLKDFVPNIRNEVHKYALLLVLNDVNTEKVEEKNQQKSKRNRNSNKNRK